MKDEWLFQYLETQLSELTVLTAYVEDPFERGYNVARAQNLSVILYNQIKDRNKKVADASQSSER